MASLDSEAYQQAMFEEHQAIEEAGTWSVHDFTNLPFSRKPIGGRWVFKVKHNADWSVERREARIVAKGYSQ